MSRPADFEHLRQLDLTNFASHRTSMVAHVLTMDELAVRRAAAWLEYQRDHVPCSTRRQMFTGGANVTDQMARSHEMMRKLVHKLDILAKDIPLASDDTAREEIRSGFKKAIDLMKGRDRYFKRYTKMATLQPAGNATDSPLSSRPSAKAHLRFQACCSWHNMLLRQCLDQ